MQIHIQSLYKYIAHNVQIQLQHTIVWRYIKQRTCRLKRKSWLRWLFRWTTGSPAVLQWWIEYQPFDAHCIRLNISIVNGWRSSLYLVGCLRRFWLMFCAVLSWRSSLHLVLNVPFAPVNNFQPHFKKRKKNCWPSWKSSRLEFGQSYQNVWKLQRWMGNEWLTDFLPQILLETHTNTFENCLWIHSGEYDFLAKYVRKKRLPLKNVNKQSV